MYSLKSDNQFNEKRNRSAGSGTPSQPNAEEFISMVNRLSEDLELPNAAGHVSTAIGGPGHPTANKAASRKSEDCIKVFIMEDRVSRKSEDSGSAGGHEFIAHVCDCAALARYMGVKIWPPYVSRLGHDNLVLASGDMVADDWDLCGCDSILSNRKGLGDCIINKVGKTIYNYSDIRYTCDNLKPLRSWCSKNVTRKVKSWRADGSGKYRDVSVSPIYTTSSGDELSQGEGSSAGYISSHDTSGGNSAKEASRRRGCMGEGDAAEKAGSSEASTKRRREGENPIRLAMDGQPASQRMRRHLQTIHMGLHSVEGKEAKAWAPSMNFPTAAQNAIQFIGARLNGWTDNVRTNPDVDMVLRTRYSVQSVGRTPRLGLVEGITPRTVAQDVEINDINIGFGGGREVLYTLKDSDAADMISGGTVNTKRLGGTMNAGPHFPQAVIDKMGPLLLNRREKINNASFYGLGWLLVHQLHSLELLGIQGVYRAQIADNMVYRHTRVAAANIDGLADNFEADIGLGRIFIDGRAFTRAELAMIGVIASGLPLVTSPNGVRRSVVQFMHSEAVPIAVYSTIAIQPLGLVGGEWDTGRVMALMRKLAEHLDDEEAWMQGYMRASAMARGIIIEWNEGEPAVYTRRWVNAFMEIGGTAWPLAGGTNPMWAWAGIRPKFEVRDAQRSEADALNIMTPHEAVTTGHIMVQMVSTGITSTLIKLNLTTTQFNQWHYGTATNDGIVMMRNLLRCVAPTESGQGRVCPLLVRMGCNWCAEFSGVTVNCTNFSSNTYNNFNAAGDPADLEPRMWAILDDGAPRLHSVMVMGFLLDCYPDVWGILAPPVSASSMREIVQSARGRYWLASLGCKEYGERSGARDPYMYVPYGAAWMNVFRQHLGVNVEWFVAMRQLNTTEVSGTVLPGNLVQPIVPVEWNRALMYAEPGTCQTYDWFNRVVLVPELSEQLVGARVFGYWAMTDSQVLCNAGLLRGSNASSRRIEVGLDALTLMCTPMAGDKKVGDDNKDTTEGGSSDKASN